MHPWLCECGNTIIFAGHAQMMSWPAADHAQKMWWKKGKSMSWCRSPGEGKEENKE